jgi:hypothetical protein
MAVQRLLEYKADIDAKSDIERMALHLAANRGHEVRLVLD